MDGTENGHPGPTPDGAHRGAEQIRLDGVSKVYADGTVGVAELDLTFAAGELSVLVGPSGCGNTTTMKMINRLIEPSTGTIEIDGQDVTGQDPVRLRRGIGYVIQQVGLFPHQKVETNVMTVPLLYGESKTRARERAHELIEMVGLDVATFAGRCEASLAGRDLRHHSVSSWPRLWLERLLGTDASQEPALRGSRPRPSGSRSIRSR